MSRSPRPLIAGLSPSLTRCLLEHEVGGRRGRRPSEKGKEFFFSFLFFSHGHFLVKVDDLLDGLEGVLEVLSVAPVALVPVHVGAALRFSSIFSTGGERR